jgi:hypothetical protein
VIIALIGNKKDLDKNDQDQDKSRIFQDAINDTEDSEESQKKNN